MNESVVIFPLGVKTPLDKQIVTFVEIFKVRLGCRILLLVKPWLWKGQREELQISASNSSRKLLDCCIYAFNTHHQLGNFSLKDTCRLLKLADEGEPVMFEKCLENETGNI